MWHISAHNSYTDTLTTQVSVSFNLWPKRTHAGFDCKVKHPAVNLKRQVRRHRTADSPRLFFVRHGPFVAIRVAEKNACRTVFTPRKDPLRPPPVLAADGSREASGASPRKRLSGQLCSRPLKPALLSPRKLVSPDLWSMPHAEPGGFRGLSESFETTRIY